MNRFAIATVEMRECFSVLSGEADYKKDVRYCAPGEIESRSTVVRNFTR
jgi:hypothetical protein